MSFSAEEKCQSAEAAGKFGCLRLQVKWRRLSQHYTSG